jgi:hypothetical protein
MRPSFARPITVLRFLAAVRLAAAFGFAAWVPASAFAAGLPAAPGHPPQAETAPAPATANAWTGSASAAWYSLPDEDDFVLPIVTLRRDRLHLEARYNYEDRSTGSLFAGWTYATGSTVEFEIVPMLGAVVGQTDGAAPAFTMTLDWKRLSVYSENEYLIDFSDHDLNFFYDWSEVTVRATGWLAAGLVAQRTRTVDNGLDVQRGLLVRFAHGPFTATAYWFNPGSDDHFAVYSAGFEF